MVVCVQAHACLCLITVSSLFMFSVNCSKFSAFICDVRMGLFPQICGTIQTL